MGVALLARRPREVGLVAVATLAVRRQHSLQYRANRRAAASPTFTITLHNRAAAAISEDTRLSGSRKSKEASQTSDSQSNSLHLPLKQKNIEPFDAG
jgi:hypothetical protein